LMENGKIKLTYLFQEILKFHLLSLLRFN
jgi:hypothetical protein